MVEPEEIVTYRVVDRQGNIRNQGMVDEARAHRYAQRLVEESSMPITMRVERVVVTMTKAVETVATYETEPTDG